MTSRERVITAMRRQVPDMVPKDLSWGLSPGALETFKKNTGADDPEEYFNIDVRFVDFNPTQHIADYSIYHKDLPSNATISEWGAASIPGSSFHFAKAIHSLQGVEDIKLIENYPLPDFMADYRHNNLNEKTKAVQDKGFAAAGTLYCTIFEVAWSIRSMEDIFIDFSFNPDAATVLLDKITDLRCRQACRFAEAGVDILMLGDDIGTQRALMMSPDTWIKWLKPRLAKVIDSARSVNPDLLIFYHSDGNCYEAIPGLIEAGIDILNPVQPECMNPAALKKEFGNDLAFWGTLGTQTVFPFGTPDDVRASVKERIETVGVGGGLLMGPTHMIEPEVPWENMKAFYEAVEEFGRYD